MTDRSNAPLPASQRDISAASETTKELDIGTVTTSAHSAAARADRLLRNGLLCMLAAVVLLIVVAFCTLSDDNPNDKKTLSTVKQLFTTTTTGTTQTIAASMHLGTGDMSPIMGLQNNLTQLSSMLDSLRQVRDRIPNALAAAFRPA